ncbi:EAL domain-containing protein [Cryobacterium sp. RTS3]|uniref:EAL domain-containing protein n=1 Tax=Cryobacterium sp. RTS3 TaxID=3048643 RepID=UPI002B23A1C3|nr:EAL domain-containing protein [Cryobacterium sp. RTS3]MEA9999725.1 EAL domain-containing protein [Cryobacterium sp. RTS3]
MFDVDRLHGDPLSETRWAADAPAAVRLQRPFVPAGFGLIAYGTPDGRVLGANLIATSQLHLVWDDQLGRTPEAQNWNPIDEWGAPIALRDLPALSALRTGAPVAETLIGLFVPGDDTDPARLAWFRISGIPVVDEAGATVGAFALLDEVTDTAEGRAATNTVLAGYRALADNVTDFVLRTDLDGVVSWASPSTTRAIGWARDALVGNPLSWLWPPGHQADAAEFAGLVARGTKAHGRIRVLCTDGSDQWFYQSSSPVLAPDGTVVGAVHDFTGIDELVAAEKSAWTDRKTLHASLAGLGDPYVLVQAVRNFNGTVIDFLVDEANPAACAFHGLPEGQFIGGSLLNPMPAAISGALGALCAEVLEQGVPCHRDGFRASSPHGNRPDRWYDFHAAPVGDRVSVIWRDVTEQHLAVQALQDSEQRYRLLAENASDVVLMVDSADRYVWSSPSLEEALGWKHDDLLNRTSAEFVHPDDVPGVQAARARQNDGVRRHSPFRVRRSDGSYRWVSTVTRDLHDAAGRTTGRVISLRDVHDETVARQSLEKSVELFRAVLTSSTTGMILCDLTGRIQVVNEALCAMLLRDETWLLARCTDELVHPDDRATVIAARALTIASAAQTPFKELRLARADGAVIWARRTASVIRTSAGIPERLVVQLEDVTAEHESREELQFQAHNDRLTGMHNREWILRILEQDLEESRDSGLAVGVLFIDLDNFKLVNDSLGHVAGDEVLAVIADRIASAMLPHDRVGRFGGDEFVVVVPNASEPADVERVAVNITAALSTELSIHGHRIIPTVSMGIALSTGGSTAASLLRDTDSALFRAKKSGRARWQFFDDTMHSQAMDRLTIEDEIRISLTKGDFVVYYQPIVALLDRSTVGYEALVRWQHPVRGLLAPADFLPIAEESRLILGIDRFVLDQVCSVLAADPHGTTTISVNVSAVDLAHESWAETFTSTLRNHGVDPSRLIVEVTETAVLSLRPSTTGSLDAVRDLGVGLHVDDFGTGFSSISLLRDLPVTGLKLDASFVAGLGDDNRGVDALAAGIAGLVAHLDLTGVAEGIETETQAQTLLSQGWLHGQGYLFGKPAPWPGQERPAR